MTVYLAYSEDTGLWKIGQSKDPEDRVQAFKGTSLVATFEGGFELEGFLKRNFVDFCVEGEWFDLGAAAERAVRNAVRRFGSKQLSSFSDLTAAELISAAIEVTQPHERLPTGILVARLAERLPEVEWLQGKRPAQAPRRLAKLFRTYGIETMQFWMEGENRRGYVAADFHLWVGRLAAAPK